MTFHARRSMLMVPFSPVCCFDFFLSFQIKFILFPVTHKHGSGGGVEVICPSVVDEKQEAQLMLTTGSTRLAVNQGQQTEPFHMLHIVSYCAIITCLQDAPFYDIRLQKMS